VTVGLFVVNFFYAFKIALEMNLGFSPILSSIELLHIFVIEIALLAYFYNMYQKESLNINLMDRSTFIDLSTLYNLDQYSMVALNIFMIIYPFRFFAFISRFNFSTSIRGMLNTITRISPGLFTYFNIVAIIVLCISISSMHLLGPIIPEMNSLSSACFMILSVNLFDLPQIRTLLEDGGPIYTPLIIFLYQQLMTCSFIIFIALAVYLFGKAVVFEKSIAVENEDEDQTDWI